MTSIDDFFAGAADEPSHPLLRDLKRRIGNGASVSLEVHRPLATVGLSRTKMLIHFVASDGEQQPEEFDWDDHLNEGLIQLKVRAVTPEQESERFALGLRDGFRTVEKEFGNGYFNSVLLDLIMDSRLDQYPEIAEVLKSTYHNRTERQSHAYARCRDAIALCISTRAKELKGPLGYSQDEAKTILAQAIARYLDDRFSVTSRRQLGLLH